ncbi:Na+/H+ antiporter NhaC [Algiphilus sp. W345]|uniref:Na+/H+ antiporter NhaC n=1 Tax=Banduia mediterranea TaxID=3075609 RepID=A0ABU2WHU2_9GAMM|nr:Na+/H+ antiporter NhaC [Algiphilus sp. W345]MDT0497436.1 Na+/H+ antiporter NhaC [Algiphilus sp. W345]
MSGDDLVDELRVPSLWQALAPLAVLALMLVAAVALFGSDASYGPNQIVLLVAAGVAAAIGIANGLVWKDFEEAVGQSIAVSSNAMLILLMVGAVIGSWILCGTVPTLIYYGLQLLHPAVYYPASCLICAVIGLAIGSSWTVAGTVGVALMGVASGLGLSPAAAAGAVISGAYFGDKMSPLSDTTNLAPAVAGSELFDHIRHMCWTTLPSFTLALIGFTVLGLTTDLSGTAQGPEALLASIDTQFGIGLHLLIPVALVLVLAMRRVPALPTLAAGVAAGLLFAAVFQPERVADLGASISDNPGVRAVGGLWHALFDGYAGDSGNANLDELLNRGGMSSMLNTIWLILCAMAFGACMERAGLLQRLIVGVLRGVKTAGALVAVTVLTAVGVNIVASDQYISIVLTGRLYRIEYERVGLDPRNLSRAIEDGGTLTSVLVPWNTCGAYMTATLGVSTFHYLPFAFFNWLSPLIAISMALAGFRLLRKNSASAAS